MAHVGRESMRFDLVKLRRLLLAFALAGIVGNQILYGYTVKSQIDFHNAMAKCYNENKDGGLFCIMAIAGQGVDYWETDYVELFANPAFTYLNIESWSIYNHLLAWPGLLLSFAWLVLRFTVKAEERSTE